MSTVDDRVVRMRFENAEFQRGIAATMSQLDALNKKLQLQGATKGLADVAAAGAKTPGALQGVESAVQGISNRFGAMAVAATTAFATVVHKATEAAGRLVKSLTLDPVMGGFREYETNIGSIQTILANTGLEGAAGLKKVTGALDELNHYSDQTIYNFSEMAKNIGTFTAAGVKLDVATAAIKGIANLAAVSGSTSEQASAAMYQLSQAISAGKVSLEDWNSVVNAGMGGKVFQNALMETARVHGVNIDAMVKKEGSFRLTLQKGWLTGEILTETLQKFTGDLTAAQLKTMGYNEQQIKGILKMGKTAQDAATKVKTVTQLMTTLREGVTSGWAKTWQLIFGDFNEAKTMFTEVGIVLGGFVDGMSDARNKILGDWKALGGRAVLIEAIGNAFKALMSVVRPIKDAFRQIFPATTGKQLFAMTVALREFTEKLKIGGETADKLKRTFAGVFAVFGIGVDIVKAIVRTIFDLVGVATQGSGGILGFTAKIGDFLVKVREAIRQGDGLKNLFKGIGAVLAVPIKLVQQLGKFLGALFKDVDGSSASKGIENVSKKLEPLGRIGEIVSSAWGKTLGVLTKVWTFFQSLGSKIAQVFNGFGDQVNSIFDGLNLQDIFSGINTGAFVGLVLMLKNLIGGDGIGGIMEGISDSIEGLTGALKGMQNALQAAALLQIAIAVGILAVSMNTLSKIDAAGLARASAAISVMFGQLIGGLVVFQKFVSSAGFAKMPFVMGSLILLAAAINILASAVTKLAVLDWNELAKGLTGVTVLIAAVVAALTFMPKPAGIIASSLGIILLATGIKILASAVTDLSGLSWEDLAKGLTGVGALLGSLILFTKFSQANAGGIAQGAGIILLAAGIKILASALKDLGEMSWSEMGKGLTAMAGGLALIGTALYFIPPTALLSAAGVLVVATSLEMIGDAVKSMGKMNWGEIGKGLTVMAGALVLIAGALFILPPSSLLSAAAIFVVAASLQLIGKALKGMAQMSWGEIAKSLTLLAGSLILISAAMIVMAGALPGAAALVVVSAALLLLVPVLKAFGEMSWGEIAKGLTMLAGVFIVIGAAGLLLAPVVPFIIALGAAVALLGIGLLAAGAGVLLFATALTALAAAGAAATVTIVGIVAGLVGLIPMVMEQIGLGLVAFARVISTAGPAILQAIKVVLESLVKAISDVTPKIVEMLLKMLSQMLSAMLRYTPKLVDTGMKLITAVLEGISRNIGKLIDAATKLTVNFLNGIGRSLPKVIQAGFDLIIKFIDGITRAIDTNSERLGAAGGRLGVAIVKGMVKGVMSGIGEITSAAGNLAQAAIDKAKAVLDINSPSKKFIAIGKSVNEGFRKGLDGNKGQIDAAFKSLQNQLSSLVSSSSKEVDKLEAKLKKLRNRKDIAKTRADLAQARKEEAASKAAYKELTKNLADERTSLGKLANQYDTVAAKLKTAKETLDAAIKTRDDYNKQISEQYSDMATPSGETKLADYIEDLEKQVENTKKFSNTLQRLRALGLNDEMYKDLVAQGASSLPFVEELLAAGKGSVDEINKLGKELDTVGSAMGKTASSALYQAAVDSAAGLVKGLENQMASIEKQMDKIADMMVKAIKKKLGIKSPSRAFMEVGGYSAEGLIAGMAQMLPAVEKAAAVTGKTALDSLSKSLTGFSDLITSDMDVRPVITPVLDLSSVRKDAGQINGMLSNGKLSVDSAYSKAVIASSGYLSNRNVDAQVEQPVASNSIQFNQYNNSPKALSSAEIYRQTKSQLSTAKGALSQ